MHAPLYLIVAENLPVPPLINSHHKVKWVLICYLSLFSMKYKSDIQTLNFADP